jgi:hypothetical protein
VIGFNPTECLSFDSDLRGAEVQKNFSLLMSAAWLMLLPNVVSAMPNGTWLSQPQIWFYRSTHQLEQVMAQIRTQHYKVVFLDYRKVPEVMQQQVSYEARSQGLTPVVWVQSPQYRSMTIPDLVNEARYGDGIQVDDDFFSHYTLKDFYALRRLYTKPIFCSIQPRQVALAPPGGCNQIDVQCYANNGFQNCVKIADQLGAVVSLSVTETLGYQNALGERRFNTFLWPTNTESVESISQKRF